MQINPSQLHPIKSLRPGPASQQQQIDEAKEVQKAFRTFVGEAFFGQMMKSMRSTQGKPAYFHGGQAEEMFRSQLDQTLAQEMTAVSADKIADPMFRQQFPQQAELLQQQTKTASLDDLGQLRRR
jgi:Rod binding domain-containing protein